MPIGLVRPESSRRVILRFRLARGRAWHASTGCTERFEKRLEYLSLKFPGYTTLHGHRYGRLDRSR